MASIIRNRSTLVHCFVSLLVLASGCGAMEGSPSEIGAASSALESASQPPRPGGAAEDEINPGQGNLAYPLAAFHCTGEGPLCLGACQRGGGPHVLGDRTTIGYGHCASAVKDFCEHKHWGDVTLACWGQ